MAALIRAGSAIIHGRVFYGWWIVLATFVLAAVSAGLYAYGISTLFIPLKEDLSDGRSGPLSLGIGVAPMVGAMIAPFQGYLVDRYGPRPVMYVGILFSAGGFILASTAQSLGVFVVYYLLIGVGMITAYSGPPFAAIGNWFIRRRGIAFGLAVAGMGVSSVMVFPVKLLLDAYGWRGTMLSIGIILLVVSYPLAALMRHRPEHYGLRPDGDPPEQDHDVAGEPQAFNVDEDFTVREAMSSRSFWLIALGSGLRMVVTVATVIHFVQAMVSKGFSFETSTMLLGFFGLMTIPGRLIAGVLADRVNKRVLTAALMSMLGIAMLGLRWASSVETVVPPLLLFATALGGLMSSVYALQGEYFGRRSFATLVGVSALFNGAGVMIGTALAGFVFDRSESYNTVFLIFAVCAGAAVVSILLARRPVRKRRGSVAVG